MLIAPWRATAALAGSPLVTGEARLHGFVLPGTRSPAAVVDVIHSDVVLHIGS
jgi:hypothetical protein